MNDKLKLSRLVCGKCHDISKCAICNLEESVDVILTQFISKSSVVKAIEKHGYTDEFEERVIDVCELKQSLKLEVE